MVTVQSRRDLSGCDAPYVLVQGAFTSAIMYQRYGDEWVRKAYFSTAEACEILGITYKRLRGIMSTIGVQAPSNHKKKIRISLAQLRRMAQMIE